MNEQEKTAGKTAPRSNVMILVVIHDCHASHNTVIENVTEAERAGIERLAARLINSNGLKVKKGGGE